MIQLPPGLYTVVVHGANNTSGVALVEVYELPRIATIGSESRSNPAAARPV